MARSNPESGTMIPQFVTIRGVSENTWERKRPIWKGDQDRERNQPPKRVRNRRFDLEDDSVDGKHEGSIFSTEDGNPL
jgi:hypothetical protein